MCRKTISQLPLAHGAPKAAHEAQKQLLLLPVAHGAPGSAHELQPAAIYCCSVFLQPLERENGRFLGFCSPTSRLELRGLLL
ncbi:hypothetical protein A2U01_0054700, partial [Trifolium medium]|nr:hypothetical protein [Trifolium medium]